MRASTLALLLCASAAAAAPLGLDPREGAVLPADVAKGLLNQCSRRAPEKVSGTWTPKPAQIEELESRLPSALKAQALERGGREVQTAGFRRQYAGFIANGRKIIHVNAIPRSLGEPAPDGPPNARRLDWRRDVFGVCDGGPSFFGVEYDPAAKKFDRFEFNGVP